MQVTIALTSGADYSTIKEIPQKDVCEGSRNLGAMLAPQGNNQDEFKKLNEAIARDAGAFRGSVANRPLPPGVTVTNVPINASNGRKNRRFNNPIEKN